MGKIGKMLAGRETRYIAAILNEWYSIPDEKINYWKIMFTRSEYKRKIGYVPPCHTVMHLLAGYVRDMDPSDRASLAKARRWVDIAHELRDMRKIESDYPIGYLIKNVKERFQLTDPKYDAELERLKLG